MHEFFPVWSKCTYTYQPNLIYPSFKLNREVRQGFKKLQQIDICPYKGSSGHEHGQNSAHRALVDCPPPLIETLAMSP